MYRKRIMREAVLRIFPPGLVGREDAVRFIIPPHRDRLASGEM